MRRGSPDTFCWIAFLVAVITVLAPRLAAAQAIVLVDNNFVESRSNPCLAGEVVAITGRQTISVYPRVDGSGGMHFTFRSVTKGTGSAPASLIEPAKDYVVSEESINESNAPALGNYEFTVVFNQAVIRKAETAGDNPALGSGDDWMIKTIVHVTSVNGVPTAWVDRGQQRCM